MGTRSIMWYFGFALLVVQIAMLESAFISKEGAFIANTHFAPVKSSKDTTDNVISIKDLRKEPFHQTKDKKDINLDELLENNGVDTFGGTNSESNAIDPDEYVPCSDGNTFCPEGCKCCVDADGDGLMECCPLGEPATCCDPPVKKCCASGLTCVVEDGEFVKCDPDNVPLLYRWMYRQYESKEN